MNTKTELFIDLWLEARTRFSDQVEDLSSEDLQKKLGDSPNSVGFLIRHIGDVELLFGQKCIWGQLGKGYRKNGD